jgi:hypothetical protein
MVTQHVRRLVSLFALTCATFLVAASCGSSGNDTGGSDASTFDAFGPGFNQDSSTGATGCTPKTCAELGYTCGANGDGCNGTLDCGVCTGTQQCGAGGGYSQCGNASIAGDGAVSSCVPKTCADLGYDCGVGADGCGGTIQCGSGACPAGEICGGGGFNKCGGSGVTPSDAGPASSEAGTAACVPATCASLGYNCGLAGDGCGGTIGPCGTCTGTLACGASKPNVCGSNIPCTGLCAQQSTCPAGTTTTLTGTVRAGLQEGATSWVPANTTPDPVPGVLVYVPQAPLAPFDSDPNNPQVQCQQCGADVSGSPLVETMTAFDGTFTLTNVPVSKSASAGDKIPVVIQLGRWRRQFAFTVSCGANPVPDLNMPSKASEGDIPLSAISTGSYDSIECVLLKMGVAQTEFMSYATWSGEAASGTAPKQGRVHIYTSTQASTEGFSIGPGAVLAPQEDETVLMGAGNDAGPANGTYMKYDQILLPCWGDAFTKTGAELGDLIDYGNAGGRFFATHYSYSWLHGNGVLEGTAQWDPKANQNNTDPFPTGQPFTGNVALNVPASNPGLFVEWLNHVGALSNGNPTGSPPAAPTVTIDSGRHDVDKVLGQSSEWIDGTDPAPPSAAKSQMLLHFTFDMPIGQTSQCGHAIYSDFHVNGTQSNGMTFPNECDKNALTAQERILEYMIWDLASCVPGPPTSSCTPKSCADQHIECGPAGDTCGNLIAGGCGTCAAGQTCGGGGMPGVCTAGPPDGGGGSSCTPETCAQQNITCGPAGDGCGNLIAGGCGVCTPPGTCGGGGVASQCPGTQGCTPRTCQELGFTCGPAGDGCGNLIAGGCGTCSPPETCGGGGVAGQCGTTMTR